MILRNRSCTVVGEEIEFCVVSSSCSLCFRESLLLRMCLFAPVSKANCNESLVMKTCAFAPVSKLFSNLCFSWSEAVDELLIALIFLVSNVFVICMRKIGV